VVLLLISQSEILKCIFFEAEWFHFWVFL